MDWSACDRHVAPLLRVGILAVIEETRVVARQNKPAAKILRPIGINLQKGPGGLGQLGDTLIRQNLIEGWMEAPDRDARRNMLASEDASAMDPARPNARPN